MYPCLISKMDVILIAAITADGYIAHQSNEIITWSKDLKLFKKQTLGWPVIMGSNTYNTLAANLEEREMIVVHRGDNRRAAPLGQTEAGAGQGRRYDVLTEDCCHGD